MDVLGNGPKAQGGRGAVQSSIACAAKAMQRQCGTSGKTPIVWVADTGSGNHLSGRAQLPESTIRYIRENPESLRLATANGVVDAKAILDIHAPELQVDARVLVLDDCPNVLSVGRLVEDNLFEFHWIPGRAWIRNSEGHDQECVVQNYVPMLSTGASQQGGCALTAASIRNSGDIMQLALPGGELRAEDEDAGRGADEPQTDGPAEEGCDAVEPSAAPRGSGGT